MKCHPKLSSHEFVLFLSEQIQVLRPILENADLPKGIIHGDVFPDNCLFEGEKLRAIIDWEEVAVGPLLLDVAITICGFCFPHNRFSAPLANAFLETYQSIRPLTDQEKASIKHFIDFGLLAIAFWRFRQFNVRHYDPDLQMKHQEMVERLQSIDWKNAQLHL